MEALLTQTAPRNRLAYDDLLAPFHASFKPEDKWRVGAEAEKFGVLSDPHAPGSFRPLPYDGPRSVRAVLDRLVERFGWVPESEYAGGEVIALKRDHASITLEPGAQLELSGAPFASVHETHDEWVEHIEELREVGEPLGISWLGLGFHPFAVQSELPWVPKLRYGIMRDYLPTRGSMGLDMMRRTCTVQANLDFSSEADALRKLRVAVALSPVFTAMFANSPLYEGTPTGERTRRGLVWLHTDPDRTGLLPFLWDHDASFDRYVEWALDAPMFLIKRGAKIIHNTGQTFRAFMRDGYAGTQASADDWFTHLGTLFPEVRLKKTIELRGVDSLPFALTPALAALAKGLFYDDQALTKAEALVSTLSHEQVQAVRRDVARDALRAELAGRPLLDWAAQVVAIANEGLSRFQLRSPHPRGSEALYLRPLEALLARGQTPADALLAQLDPSQPLAPQVVQYSKL